MVKQISLNLDGDVKQVVNVNSVFARHETFHPRFGWIKKGFDAALNSFVFVQEDAPVRLGVGKNMVSSIRYWCNAFKVLENDRPSDFGDRLLKDDGWDPYLEDPASIPVLGVEHFELLMKDQDRFAVKYFEVVGLRSQVFKELEAILRQKNASVPPKVRNSTLLMVVKPLFQFVKKLPAYTTKTKRLSSEALAVLQTLQQAQEPDELLFTSLPKACGLPPIIAGDEEDGTLAKTLTFVSNFRQFHT